MKLNVLLAIGFALIAMACAEKKEALPDEPQITASPEAGAPAPAPASVDSAVLKHMHMHAEQLDALNFALKDDDLEAARTPAYWLSRHDTIDGLDPGLQEYVYAMRIAAEAVEVAPDLETARAAAENIADQCQDCHKVAGVDGG